MMNATTFLRYVLIAILLVGSLWAKPATSKHPVTLIPVIIHGNKALPRSEYLEALGVDTKAWYQFWKSDAALISPKAAADAEEKLRDFLDARGYYDAKVSVKKSRKNLTVTVRENKPVIVQRVSVESDFKLSNLVKFKKGSRFEAAKFVAIKRAIKSALMKAGYCNYQLDTKAYVDLKTHAVVVKYRVEKGNVCHFGKTRIISKPATISERVIRSRLRYREGDVFDTEKITETFNALNSLDVFDSGTVSPKDREDDAPVSNTVPMEISLSPKEKWNLFKGGVGYDTALGMRLQLYYERRNFIGDARKVTAKMHYAKKSQFGEVTYFSPAVLNWGDTYLDMHAKLGYAHNIYDAYTNNKGYFQTELNYNRDAISATMGLGFEHLAIQKTGTRSLPNTVEGNFLMLYPYVNLVFDRRDSKIDPKNGYYLSAYSEYGLGYLKGSSRYLKFLLEGRYITTMGNFTLATVGKVGILDASSGKLPASKLFYAGGAYSNRAFGTRQLGVTSASKPVGALGGRTWLNLSVEGTFPLYDDLYGAVFLDNTMISPKEYHFKGKWLNSLGVGLRYKTPIGPIKVDVGMNIRKPHQYGITFQIGQSF